MPPASVIHACTVLAAAALLLLLRPAGSPRLRLVGAVVGIGAFTGILAQLPTFFDGQVMPGGTFFLPFALISVISAVQMITTSRRSMRLAFCLGGAGQQWFVGHLGAEFLGFAVVIVYAGAVLITYMFVLMLAQQAQSPDLEDERPTYDRLRENPSGGPWLPSCSWRS